MANQNIDGLWLFALIVILTGGRVDGRAKAARRKTCWCRDTPPPAPASAAGEAQTLGQFVVISF